jgi:hypothetical protein
MPNNRAIESMRQHKLLCFLASFSYFLMKMCLSRICYDKSIVQLRSYGPGDFGGVGMQCREVGPRATCRWGIATLGCRPRASVYFLLGGSPNYWRLMVFSCITLGLPNVITSPSVCAVTSYLSVTLRREITRKIVRYIRVLPMEY